MSKHSVRVAGHYKNGDIMKRFGLYLSLALILFLILAPLVAVKEAFSTGKIPWVIERLHLNTGNTTRLAEQDWHSMQRFVLKQRYDGVKPDAVVVVDADAWPLALACQSFSGEPLNLPVILFDPTETSINEVVTGINTWSPSGLNEFDGADVLLVGENTLSLENELQQEGHSTLVLSSPDIFAAVAVVRDTLLKAGASKSRDLLVVGDDNVKYALPAAAWMARRGTPVLLVERDKISDATRKALDEITSNNIYVLAPPSQVSNSVVNELQKWGQVTRIGEEDPAAHAVFFARFYDATNRFGWQATQDTAEAARHFLLGSTNEDWRMFLAGVQLFSGPNFGPLLYTSADRLSAQTEKFLWSTTPDWWVTPAEGPFNHTWILGEPSHVSYAVQGRVDFIQELRDYLDQGDQGISGIDALALVWFALALACAAWTWFHLSTRLTQAGPFMKLSWMLVMLVLGPIGLWSYYVCYRGYNHQVAMGEFPRPLWVQVLSATLGTVGFGMSTMVTVAFLLAYFGLPLFILEGPLFWLGSPMTQSILWSYLAALAVNIFIFVPLMLRSKEPSAYRDTVRDNALTVFFSMTAISIGMMGAMWLMQMRGLTVMPEEENLTWWATVWGANIIGLITGYIGNWPLVVRGRKIGTM